jgi:hypothetical protein
MADESKMQFSAYRSGTLTKGLNEARTARFCTARGSIPMI